MLEIAIVIWAVLAGYTAVCVWLPELRLFHWKATDAKMGGISYLGFALFFWSPLLLILGVVPKLMNLWFLD